MEHQIALDFFQVKKWTPLPFQETVWQKVAKQQSGLIHSPTGTGKTYAVWLGLLMTWMKENPPPYSKVKRKATAPLLLIWVTPLKALASDTLLALKEPVDVFDLPFSLELRTGDTSSTIRSRQSKKLPTVLITTPESLSLLLTHPNGKERFGSLKMVVVDEWHELMGSKRGTQTELALSRLRALSPSMMTWGLSATMGNLKESLDCLMGMEWKNHQLILRSGELIQGTHSKKLQVQSILPEDIKKFPWGGHTGLALLPQVAERIEKSTSSLIFTNTRSQTEFWYQALLRHKPEWAGEIALHHGSLDVANRLWVEQALKDGKLRCVVCTSSLDLGVDFPEVDSVFQIGSPKGVARLLQRAGRSGHNPQGLSIITCVPAHALELLEISAAREGILSGRLEQRVPPDHPLDVLSQHLVSIGLSGGFYEKELYDEVRTCYSYRNLSRQDWQWTLDFVSTGGSTLKSYDRYHRLSIEDGRYQMDRRDLASIHRLSVGTIVSDPMVEVQYVGGKRIGLIEESFAAGLRKGDLFTLSGKVLEFIRLHEMKVQVRRSLQRKRKGIIPRWVGGSLPLSQQLTKPIRKRLEQVKDGCFEDTEMEALKPVLQLQRERSFIPGENQLLIEYIHTAEGYGLYVYPFEGRAVHQAMAALVSYRLSEITPGTYSLSSSDYGFQILCEAPMDYDSETLRQLFDTKNLWQDLKKALNFTEMSRRHFREIARVSGLLIQRAPGMSKSIRQLQASSGLIFDVLLQYDSENLLLKQAENEVLDKQLDQDRIWSTFQRIEKAELIITTPDRITPFAFPLLVNNLYQTVSNESLEERIQKIQKQVIAGGGKKKRRGR